MVKMFYSSNREDQENENARKVDEKNKYYEQVAHDRTQTDNDLMEEQKSFAAIGLKKNQ